VKGRLDVVAGVVAAALVTGGVAVKGTAEVGGGPSLVLATLGPQSPLLVPPVPPPVGVVVPVVGEVVGVVGEFIDAGMVVEVVVHAAAAPAVPVNPETMTSEVTAIPDPMINRLAHISVALLFVEANASAYPK
jgi:hypothetical protein